VAERELSKSDWATYFAEFATHKHFQPPEQTRIDSLSYDQRTGILELSLGDRQYLIHQPKSIFVDDTAGMLKRFKIIDVENYRHIVQLHKPHRLRISPAILNEISEVGAEFCPNGISGGIRNLIHRLIATAIAHHLEQTGRALPPDAPGSQSHILAASPLIGTWKETTQQQPRNPAALVPWQLRCVTEHIQNNLSEPIQVADLAIKLRLSKSHFSYAFCEATGTSPRQYIIRKRLERVQELLLQDLTPLSLIAVECGFADQPHMTRLFTRAYGISPGLWRKSWHATASLESISG
jgi:AraC family transcriptional regulator